MNKFKLLGIVRHVVGAAGGIAVGLGLIEPETADTITAATEQVAETALVAAPSFSEVIGALAIIASFAWSYFAPEKKG